ncbi:MAG: single-stranded DNA-binding protein [Lachnospiraceae bacterium]|nr:single-stranded DNA-binding protein [Lachnospiraceae bacterium]
MNKVILMGRLTRDPEIRYSNNSEPPLAIARFSLAVDRRFNRNNNGNEQTADFINCVAFGKLAEHAGKYYHKGLKIAASGRIQTGSYNDKETGKKVYTTEVVIEDAEFAESKNASSGNGFGDGGDAGFQGAPAGAADDFMNIPEGIVEEMPFNKR